MNTTLLDTENNISTGGDRTLLSSSIVAYTPIEQQLEPYEGIPVFVQTHEIDGRYFADVLMEIDLPHHGEGATPDEAIDSLFEALKVSWEALHSARKLSSHMEKRKLRLDNLFSHARHASSVTW